MADLDRERADDALQRIRVLEPQGVDTYGNYVSFVKALPAVILQTGLGQALATELAASGTGNATQMGHYHLFHDVNRWLGRNAETAPYRNGYNEQTGILQPLMSGDEKKYIQAQHEALAYVAWLKKFAVALLIQPEGEG